MRNLATSLLVLGSFFLCGPALSAPGETPTAPAPTSASALGALLPELPGCGCAAGHPEVEALALRIASSANVEEARELALEDTWLAQSALRRARWLAPGSDSIRAAGDRLDGYETRVMAAADPEEVAQQFASLMHNNNVDVDLDTPAKCHYTTGDIIVIILGLLLGIIPGLILLVVLC